MVSHDHMMVLHKITTLLYNKAATITTLICPYNQFKRIALCNGCHRRLADWRSRGDQTIISPLPGHEVIMGALLYDCSLGDDGDDVCRLDGGQSVCDDDAGPPLPRLVQSLLHSLRNQRAYCYH